MINKNDKIEKLLTLFGRTTDQYFTLEDFKKKIASGRNLRIKYGVDVTAPFLHIGHAVNLWMMRELQELRHKVVFLIGDFTTKIGDPTGRLETRPVVPQEEIEKNAKEFIKQASSILKTNPDVFEVRRNSEWFDAMPTAKFVNLLSMVTHSRLISRDMFQERIKNNREIYMNEIIYPILQGYDSAMVESDLTIIGTDQLFNEMMGRFFQEKFNQEPQVIITSKITPGIRGKEKQSKSLGNYIALEDDASDKFWKVMSIPDNLIIQYLEVYTTVNLDKVRDYEKALKSKKINPRDVKLFLAESIVERYHGYETASKERTAFLKAFSEHKIPFDAPEVKISSKKISALNLLKILLPDISNSERRRLITQSGVRINDNEVKSAVELLGVKDGDIVQVGKTRWWRLGINSNLKTQTSKP